jgi:hypothetical protein
MYTNFQIVTRYENDNKVYDFNFNNPIEYHPWRNMGETKFPEQFVHHAEVVKTFEIGTEFKVIIDFIDEYFVREIRKDKLSRL